MINLAPSCFALLSPDDENILDNSDGERPQKRMKKTEEDFIEGDPADFLLSNSKYHDCHLTVGKPETDEIEKIGVSSTQLIAHSPVFRDMLADSELADPSGSNTHITDVSPATFKLMLRHVYGGKLPNMTPEEAADLALCADKYNIQRLVGKAAKFLKPTNAEDVFPAFMVVMFITCPDLEHQVAKIIQQETDKIVQNPNFLELDENCIRFIVKQTTLNISELDLWNNLVRWAENQVQKHPEKTLRGCLDKALPNIRLLVLTVDEIAKHVVPTKILTPEEFMDLTLAVTNKEITQMSGLCNLQEKRVIYKEYHEYIVKPTTSVYEQDSKSYSTLTIKTTKSIEVDTFTLKSAKIKPKNDSSYRCIDLSCYVTIYTSSDGHVKTFESVTVSGRVVPNQTVILPVKKNDGQSLILEANKVYTLTIQASPALPVHSIPYSFPTDITGYGLIVTYEDQFHIIEIAYRVLE